MPGKAFAASSHHLTLRRIGSYCGGAHGGSSQVGVEDSTGATFGGVRVDSTLENGSVDGRESGLCVWLLVGGESMRSKQEEELGIRSIRMVALGLFWEAQVCRAAQGNVGNWAGGAGIFTPLFSHMSLSSSSRSTVHIAAAIGPGFDLDRS